MKKIIFLVILLSMAVMPVMAQTYQVNDKMIFKAMKAELDRSMKQLKLDNLKSPYFIEYKLTLNFSHSITANLGSLNENDQSARANISVGVRVGDYKFDNSNYSDIGLTFFGSGDDEENFKGRSIPIELDETAVRREFWLATDAAYKQTAEVFSKKEASLKNKIRKDTTNDFMKMVPTKNYQKIEIPMSDVAKLEEYCREVSAVFAKYPEIAISAVAAEYPRKVIFYVNSEGTEYVKCENTSGFEILANTQAKDGMPISDYYAFYALNQSELPTKDSLIRAAVGIAENLKAQLNAPTLDEAYSGPVLFLGQAAAEAFAQVFAPNLVAQRTQMSDGGFFDDKQNTAFQNKIGGRVLPEFLSVEAKPSLKVMDKTSLFGHFTLDDNGTAPSDMPMVTAGYLKALFAERIPTRRVKESNGHKRGGAAMYSNLVLKADNKKYMADEKDLKKQLLKLVKDRELPYGIIVKKVMNQNVLYTSLYRTTFGNIVYSRDGKLMPLEFVRIYPDGREELITGGEIAGLTVQSFKDIIKTGKTPYVHNLLASSVISSYSTGGDSYIPASVVVPSLLFEDAEIKTFDEDFKKPPFMTNPVSVK